MSTEIKFMNKSDKYNYFADKIRINYWFFIKNKVKTDSIYCPSASSYMRITRQKGKTRFNICSNHNLNRIIREWGLESFDMRGGTSTFAYDDNFIPRNLRHYLLKKQAYTHRYLREQAVHFLFERLNSIELEIKQIIYTKFNIESSAVHIFKSINLVEICFDIESLSPIEFSKSRELKSSFDRHVRSASQEELLKNGGRTFPSHEHSQITSAKTKIDNGRLIIACRNLDMTLANIYTKEISKDIILNRVERKFVGRQQIKKYTNNSFYNELGFNRIISALAKVTFNTFFPIMNIPLNFSNKKDRLLIKQKCRDHFGKYYEYAYEDLTTGNCAITTGKSGKSMKAVQHKARVLTKAKTFLKCKRRGVYIVDKKHLKTMP